MTGFYYGILVLQGFLLAALLWRAQATASRAAMFAPISWFVGFYVLSFLLPQIALPAYEFHIGGMSEVLGSNVSTDVVKAQLVLVLFLFAFTAVFLLSSGRITPKLRLQSFTPSERSAALVFCAVGFAATLAIAAGFEANQPRSGIVGSTTGRMLYALSFWFTMGFVVMAAHHLKSKRYLMLAVVIVLFASSLFVLGGRGRVLWPLVGLVAWGGITGHLRVSFWKLATVGVLFGMILLAMEPLLLYVRGASSAADALAHYQAQLNPTNLFFSRNFDTFQFFAVIILEDRVEPDPFFLLRGSQAAFMETYFPHVIAAGVGYPATLPGGLWLSGRWTMVGFGGAVFGLWFQYLTRLYGRSESELEMAVYVVAISWLANIGTSLLDSHEKIAAAVLPGLLLVYLCRGTSKRTRRRRWMLRKTRNAQCFTGTLDVGPGSHSSAASIAVRRACDGAGGSENLRPRRMS